MAQLFGEKYVFIYQSASYYCWHDEHGWCQLHLPDDQMASVLALKRKVSAKSLPIIQPNANIWPIMDRKVRTIQDRVDLICQPEDMLLWRMKSKFRFCLDFQHNMDNVLLLNKFMNICINPDHHQALYRMFKQVGRAPDHVCYNIYGGNGMIPIYLILTTIMAGLYEWEVPFKVWNKGDKLCSTPYVPLNVRTHIITSDIDADGNISKYYRNKGHRIIMFSSEPIAEHTHIQCLNTNMSDDNIIDMATDLIPNILNIIIFNPKV